jgi:two-component system response regulator AlgR
MKILIADDEPLARDRLLSLIKEIQPTIETATANNGLEVLKQLPIFDPDIVLMDIKMPGLDGLETAKQISQLSTPPAIIFTTAYAEHALDAFDTQAIAYLLKPIKKEQLKKKIEACFQLNKAQSLHKKAQMPLRTFVSSSSQGHISRIDMDSICYFSADNKYVRVIYQLDNKIHKALIDDTLKQLEKDFAAFFIRVHHKTLVKISLLETLSHQPNGQFMLQLAHCHTLIEVSRRHVSEVRKQLKIKSD